MNTFPASTFWQQFLHTCGCTSWSCDAALVNISPCDDYLSSTEWNLKVDGMETGHTCMSRW